MPIIENHTFSVQITVRANTDSDEIGRTPFRKDLLHVSRLRQEIARDIAYMLNDEWDEVYVSTRLMIPEEVNL